MPEKKVIKAVEIQKWLKEKKLVIGANRIIKGLKLSAFEKIFLSSNCPSNIVKDVNYYSKIGKVEVVKLKYSNEELGVVCKKPFSISIMGLLKGK